MSEVLPRYAVLVVVGDTAHDRQLRQAAGAASDAAKHVYQGLTGVLPHCELTLINGPAHLTMLTEAGERRNAYVELLLNVIRKHFETLNGTPPTEMTQAAVAALAEVLAGFELLLIVDPTAGQEYGEAEENSLTEEEALATFSEGNPNDPDVDLTPPHVTNGDELPVRLSSDKVENGSQASSKFAWTMEEFMAGLSYPTDEEDRWAEEQAEWRRQRRAAIERGEEPPPLPNPKRSRKRIDEAT